MPMDYVYSLDHDDARF